LIAALLVAPLALSAACSDDPVVPAVVAVPDAGTSAPVDTGSGRPTAVPSTLFTKVNEPGIGIYVFDPKK
jgi:hypothetical protein